MRALRIALAQGALFDDALTALAAIGRDVSGVTRDARRLLVRADDFEIVRARPSDIATYVERGAADLGIVGKDVLEETGARVLELVDLGFGGCRFVVAAPRA
ncbi:MAG: ATP phosphoribosyltransferase, partial [Chloroflexi bacterium]